MPLIRLDRAYFDEEAVAVLGVLGGASRWLALVAALVIVASLGVALRRRRVLGKLRAAEPEWSSGSSVASTVLPRIARLRGAHLSGAPVPSHHTLAHKWLLGIARQFVAQFGYFRNPESPRPDVPHATRDHAP